MLLLMPLNLQANDDDTSPSETLAIELQKYYQTLGSLGFSFIQKTSGQMSGRPKSGKGHALFARTASGPKMRWNYNAPDRQVLISDGQIISMYFEKLNQMIVASAEETQTDVFLSFFTGDKPITDNFIVLDTDTTAGGDEQTSSAALYTLSLMPRDNNSQISVINIWLDHDKLIRRIELLDHFGTKTVINISDIKVNHLSLSADELQALFDFKPPEGTEIIKQ